MRKLNVKSVRVRAGTLVCGDTRRVPSARAPPNINSIAADKKDEIYVSTGKDIEFVRLNR